MSIEWEDWALPLVTLSAALIWLRVLLRGLHRVSSHQSPPDASRIGTLATVTLVAWCMVASSLLYPDIINVESSRLFLTIARLSILVGGVWVWWAGRNVEVPA